MKQTIRRYAELLAACSEVCNEKEMTGYVRLKFHIRPDGRVRRARIATEEFEGTDVGHCVKSVVLGMQFPETTYGKDRPISYPFELGQ